MKTLKYAWRFLMRSKSYTIINLLGLAFSLACSIILMRYIHRELTVDAHSVDPEHITPKKLNTQQESYHDTRIKSREYIHFNQSPLTRRHVFIPECHAFACFTI